ncbi:MAG: cytochrome c biogenesis CcdA family protein [Kribbellaceae bacterium]
MDGVPLGLALAAGTLAVVNPCGFALLPAYASMLVLGGEPHRRGVAVGRALAFAAAMTAGFVLVFGIFGLALASVAGPIQERLPWFTVVLGLVLAASGGWLVAGRTLPGPRIATRGGPALTRSLTSMTFFGIAYALASLGCTIGPFLVTVVASFRTGSVVDGVAVFGAYAVGMGIVVAAVSIAVALARSSVVGVLRRVSRLVSRLAGLLLMVAGGYVAYYGWYEIRLQRGAGTDDPVIEAAATVQRWLAAGLDRIGVLGAALALFALLLIAALLKRSRT